MAKYRRSRGMSFRSSNYHKSNLLEQFASTLSALEFIMEFRRRNRAVFTVVMVIVVALVAALAWYLIPILWPGLIA